MHTLVVLAFCHGWKNSFQTISNANATKPTRAQLSGGITKSVFALRAYLAAKDFLNFKTCGMEK